MLFKRREHTARLRSDARLLQSGSEFFDRLFELISSAESYIHLQFYLFNNDETGKRVADALIAAAQRGVRVYMVWDGYASSEPDSSLNQLFRASGIRLKRYAPVSLLRLKVGRRLHHKVLVVDGHTALIGGINIADKYSGFNNQKPWLDFAVELKGKVVSDIEKVCIQLWNKREIRRFLKERISTSVQNLPSGEMIIRLLQNQWVLRKIEISTAYKRAIREADEELVIVASYFFPGTTIRRLLRKATSRGVRVRVVLGKYSDVFAFKPAIMFLYEWMLKNGVEIYEWQPSVLHGKMLVKDGYEVNVGSYNLNAISDYASLELNVEIHHAGFATDVMTRMTTIIETGCKQITSNEFSRNNNRLLFVYRWFCFIAIRLSLRILFTLTREKHMRL